MRCSWVGKDPQMVAYHDEEWGVPEYDGRALWEKLMLDGFQAGLSWSIVLRKRDAFRKALRNFDPRKVASFDESDVSRLLGDPGIIRSRAKIEATIGGARAYLKMRLVRKNRGWLRVPGACQVSDRGRVRGIGRCGIRRISS